MPSSAKRTSACGATSCTAAVQRALPEAVPLQVEVESLEGQLAIVLRADAQVEQGEFEAEGIEFDALQAGRYGGVVGQLLIGDALGDTRQDQEAKQAADQHERHAGERSLHSIGHDRKYSWRMDALGMAWPGGSPNRAIPAMRSKPQNQGLEWGSPSWEGKSAAGQHLPFTYRPARLVGATQHLRPPFVHRHLRRLLQQISTPPSAVVSNAGFSRLW